MYLSNKYFSVIRSDDLLSSLPGLFKMEFKTQINMFNELKTLTMKLRYQYMCKQINVLTCLKTVQI